MPKDYKALYNARQILMSNSYGVDNAIAKVPDNFNSDVGLRYDTIFSGVPTGNLKFYQDDVQKKLNALKGYLLIKYYPTRTASVQTLAAHIKQMELQGKLPDMILVDYADKLKPIQSTPHFQCTAVPNYQCISQIGKTGKI